MPALSDSEFDKMMADLQAQMRSPPSPPQPAMTVQALRDAAPQFEPRLGIDIVGRGVTNPIIAAIQLWNEASGGRGLTPAQLDRNAAMRGPLYSHALREHPEFLGQPKEPWSYGVAERRSNAEDLNSVKVIYDNWRKQNMGEELSPQERVTQSFVDARNPNLLWFLKPE